MADDEEIVLKGSALYDHLHTTGFTNFESYEPNQDGFTGSRRRTDNSNMQIAEPAPQWTVDHLNCILRSGLTLEDHRHFIESYYPLQIQENSTAIRNLLFCTAPLACLLGYMRRAIKIHGLQAIMFTTMGIGGLCAVSSIQKTFQKYRMHQSLQKLQLSVVGLEKVFLQFKKMMLLVHQNDFISQNISLGQNEMLELKKNLRSLLLNALEKIIQLSEELKLVPLAVNVDSVLYSLSIKDMSNISDENPDSAYSMDSLKKLFNSYILVQSEFLRRLALCYCPDIWCALTSKAIILYAHNKFPEIIKWSSHFLKTQIQEQKLYRAVMESKEKNSQLKFPSSSGWDYSDVYISVRSATTYFQSLLLQTQGLQDILESGHTQQTKNDANFRSTIAQMLIDISKETHSCQACIDGSLVQIYKMINANEPAAKIIEPEAVPSLELNLEGCSDTTVHHAIEDEVFELVIPREVSPHSSNCGDSDNEFWDDEPSRKKVEKKKKVETSAKVLQELKVALVKKAEEWKEREKKALESKGIPYTAPEQVQPCSMREEINSSLSCERLEFLPTSIHNDWPLPRLKGPLQNHRRGSKVENTSIKLTELSHMPGEHQAPSEGILRMGFGASLLAEAMAKSRAMHSSRDEEVFLNIEDSVQGEDN